MHTTALGSIDFKITSSAYGIPIILYYKYENENDERWRVWGVLGAVLLYNEFDYKNNDSIFYGDVREKESDSAVMPRLEAGAEFVLTETIRLFFGLGYQFNGRIDTELVQWFEETYIDFSGITFDLGVRLNIF